MPLFVPRNRKARRFECGLFLRALQWLPSLESVALMNPAVIGVLDISSGPEVLNEMIKKSNGKRTIPQIFIGDHYIGGNDKLQEANKNGELDKLLA